MVNRKQLAAIALAVFSLVGAMAASAETAHAGKALSCLNQACNLSSTCETYDKALCKSARRSTLATASARPVTWSSTHFHEAVSADSILGRMTGMPEMQAWLSGRRQSPRT